MKKIASALVFFIAITFFQGVVVSPTSAAQTSQFALSNLDYFVINKYDNSAELFFYFDIENLSNERSGMGMGITVSIPPNEDYPEGYTAETVYAYSIGGNEIAKMISPHHDSPAPVSYANDLYIIKRGEARDTTVTVTVKYGNGSKVTLTQDMILSDNSNITTAENSLNLESNYLIKNKQFAEVFWVDRNLCLRWIQDEQVAQSFYGPTWNHQGVIKEFDSIPSEYSFCDNIDMQESNAPTASDLQFSPNEFLKELSKRAEEGDTSGVDELMYVPSVSTCEDNCLIALESTASIAAVFEGFEYPIRWQDAKQIVFSTGQISLERGIFTNVYLYFAKDANGHYKLVFLDGEEHRDMQVDSDQDGLIDSKELCQEVDEDVVCVETDPHIRDTDGNGWWDGVNRAYQKSL